MVAALPTKTGFVEDDKKSMVAAHPTSNPSWRMNGKTGKRSEEAMEPTAFDDSLINSMAICEIVFKSE